MKLLTRTCLAFVIVLSITLFAIARPPTQTIIQADSMSCPGAVLELPSTTATFRISISNEGRVQLLSAIAMKAAERPMPIIDDLKTSTIRSGPFIRLPATVPIRLTDITVKALLRNSNGRGVWSGIQRE